MDTHKNEYSTPKQQIEKLKAQGLIINDENYAASVLSCYGYSNLIKSYREPYIFHDNGKLRYRSGVTFHLQGSQFNVRLLVYIDDYDIPYFLCAFNEKQGKRSTDYSTYTLVMKERIKFFLDD